MKSLVECLGRVTSDTAKTLGDSGGLKGPGWALGWASKAEFSGKNGKALVF